MVPPMLTDAALTVKLIHVPAVTVWFSGIVSVGGPVRGAGPMLKLYVAEVVQFSVCTVRSLNNTWVPLMTWRFLMLSLIAQSEFACVNPRVFVPGTTIMVSEIGTHIWPLAGL